MGPGTVTADLHGKTKYQARVTVDALLRRGHSWSSIRQALNRIVQDADDFLEE